jgi:hypothetical protein
MASYQIPQFLDSGDKILGPLNLRQFGYAMGFGFATFAVFQISFAIFPGAGWFNLVPASPFALLGAYLSFGKYNSRDAEIYVFAAILFNVKPRRLIYTRVPDLYDLEEKLSGVTVNNIANTMKKRLAKNISDKAGNGMNDFNLQNREEKAKKILQLANFQDNIATQTREKIVQMDIQKESVVRELKTKEFIQKQGGNQNQNRAIYNLQNQPFETSPVLNTPQPAMNATLYDFNTQNFLQDEEVDDGYPKDYV